MGSFEAEGNEGFGVSVSVSLSRGPIRNLTTLTTRTGYLYTGCAWRTASLSSLSTAHINNKTVGNDKKIHLECLLSRQD